MSRIRISLDYWLMELNIDVAIESYATLTGCNCKDKATQNWNFVIIQANIMHSYKI